MITSGRTNGDLSIRLIWHGDANRMNSHFDEFSMRRLLAIHLPTEAMNRIITALGAAKWEAAPVHGVQLIVVSINMMTETILSDHFADIGCVECEQQRSQHRTPRNAENPRGSIDGTNPHRSRKS